MSVLALDPGSSFGWAVSVQESGTWDVRPGRGDSPGMRYIYLRQKLESIRTAHPDLVLIAYEQAHHRGGAATAYGHGYEATIQAWCAEHKIQHVAVHSSRIKRHALGKGNAPKDAMLEAAKAKGWKPANDDHADALWILDYAKKLNGE